MPGVDSNRPRVDADARLMLRIFMTLVREVGVVKLILEVVHPHRPKFRFSEVKNFMAN